MRHTPATQVSWSAGVAPFGAPAGTTRHTIGTAVTTRSITRTGELMDMAPGITHTQAFMERPEEFMDHTAVQASALATTRLPERMRAAPLPMDHTVRVEPRKLITRGQGPMLPRARAQMFTVVGDRHTFSVAMTG